MGEADSVDELGREFQTVLLSVVCMIKIMNTLGIEPQRGRQMSRNITVVVVV